MLTPRTISSWFLASTLLGCATPAQNTVDGAEWRKQADTWQAKYQDLDKQVDRLLQILPRATEAIDARTLRETYRDHRSIGDLVAHLDKEIAKERDQGDGGIRYRMYVQCGGDKDSGHYDVSVARANGGGKKARGKGAKLKLADRLSCPSTARIDLGPQQLGEGDFRVDVIFDADAGRSYQFQFELHRLEPLSDKSEVVCSAGTGVNGPPRLSNSCDISLKLSSPPSDLPVAR